MVTNLKQILALAEEKGAAIPAFNCYNMESAMGVMQAARETGAPVIFQMFSRMFDTEFGPFEAAAIHEAIRQLPTPAVMHLDHGAGIPEVLRALRLGATGIMIDASTKPLDENIATTRRAVEICAECGVSVEGELGHVGGTADEKMSDFTDVEEAKRFAKETGVAAMAVMVGTAHGVYKKAPVLDIQRIADIHRETGLPLVLHGGSGVPDDQVKMAVKAGVRKMNFATDLVYAFFNSVYAKNGEIRAMDVFMQEPVEAIKKYCIEKIQLLGADKIL
ncbi:MAG: class II fructose-bisphosphate aldolase [Clostridiales bacterium]|nr:class II fructose-bisphosphate aldolase [Clostridiales bacterium]MDY2835275.1 class II fructose-bisphosphate aldolase [Candidatus Aphodomonas sp.]